MKNVIFFKMVKQFYALAFYAAFKELVYLWLFS
jgi:hypothetical protein